MTVKRFLICSENDTSWGQNSSSLRFGHFNPAKPYAPQIVTGTFAVPFDLDDSFWISARIAKRANNQWKKNYFVLNRFPVGFCSTARSNIPDCFAKLFKPKSMTGHCSIPKGAYNLDHESIHWCLANYPTMPYGSYLMSLTGQQLVNGVAGNTFQLCTEFDMTPQP
ncbi:uncharacterized protein LOC117650765 [Thrips palmi]|uniref:Uncharacterized protein LOC117650765 n=1 Tax=Thrips palmi TaxID=161013 RepID=A0A6P8ZZZ8_THRPL|nr:uncharacterized protein LOC117650765 [Thrips palmi]